MLNSPYYAGPAIRLGLAHATEGQAVAAGGDMLVLVEQQAQRASVMNEVRGKRLGYPDSMSIRAIELAR